MFSSFSDDTGERYDEIQMDLSRHRDRITMIIATNHEFQEHLQKYVMESGMANYDDSSEDDYSDDNDDHHATTDMYGGMPWYHDTETVEL